MNKDDHNSAIIHKNIPTPLYYQLYQILKTQIDSGELRPGNMISTEKDLMEEFGISRATIRQAILQLVKEGYVRREKSKGTIVTTPPSKLRFMEGLRGFSAEMIRRGIPYYTKVLKKSILPASNQVAIRLEIEPGEKVFFLRRLRIVEQKPFLIDDHYIPYRFVPGIETKIEDNVSLYFVLDNVYHLYLHHGWREFIPVNPATKEEVELLDVTSNTSLLYIESVLYDKENKAVDYYETKVHGKFTVDIMNTNEVE